MTNVMMITQIDFGSTFFVKTSNASPGTFILVYILLDSMSLCSCFALPPLSETHTHTHTYTYTHTHTHTHTYTHARVKETIEVIIPGTNETHSKCGVRGSMLNTWMFYINYMDVF